MRVLFWTLWTIATLGAAAALGFFLWGLTDGTVSSDNIGIWLVLLAFAGVPVAGSLGLKRAGRTGLGVVLLLLPAVPALLYAVFIAAVVLSGARWN